MLTTLQRILSVPPDPALADAGARGELLVARGRLALIAFIVWVPISAVLQSGGGRENYVALAFAVTAFALAGAVLVVVRRGFRAPWLGFATSIADVTFISAAQLAYLLNGLPSVAVNSRTTYPIYFIALTATCIRWDVRVCVAAGILATLEYAGITWAAHHIWQGTVLPDAASYGVYIAGQQVGRIILLLTATALCAVVVWQSGRLRHSSTHDALTGLHNRAFFDERLEEELGRAARTKRPLSVAILDVDHFKRVNDGYGHTAGDVVLRSVADVVRSAVRRSDLVARYGGEEFVVAFLESDEAEAVARMEDLRTRLAATSVTVAGARIAVTVSAGVAALDGAGPDRRVLLDAADRRLLAAKQGGRNRVEPSPPARVDSATLGTP